MYDLDDKYSTERICYCGVPVSLHCKDTYELHGRRIRCHLLQHEIETFQNHDSVRAALR